MTQGRCESQPSNSCADDSNRWCGHRFLLVRVKEGLFAGLQVGVSFRKQLGILVTHSLGPAAADHHLKIDWLQAVLLESVDDPGRAGDALPRPHAGFPAVALFVFDEPVQIALEYEKHLLHLVRMRRVALPHRQIHHAQSKAIRRDGTAIVVLARPARANEAVLGAAITIDAGVCERVPVGLTIAESRNELVHDFVERRIDEFWWAGMLGELTHVDVYLCLTDFRLLGHASIQVDLTKRVHRNDRGRIVALACLYYSNTNLN